jgi:hypothetical protein
MDIMARLSTVGNQYEGKVALTTSLQRSFRYSSLSLPPRRGSTCSKPRSEPPLLRPLSHTMVKAIRGYDDNLRLVTCQFIIKRFIIITVLTSAENLDEGMLFRF